MKITFIIAKEDGQYSKLHQLSQGRLFPPVSLAAMVRMVPKQSQVQVIDERRNTVQHSKKTDIVVIFINGYNRQRSAQLAKKYQSRGSFVVMTGPVLNVDSLIDGIAANCFFIGSGDECMKEFLADYSRAKVKEIYSNTGRKWGAEPISMTFGDVTLSLAS